MDSRRNEIYKILLSEGSTTVKELCDKLHCSCSTIYRDLDYLSSQSLILRRFGTIEARDPETTDFSPRIERNVALKQKLSKIAVSLLLPEEYRIFIDCSSSTHYMYKFLTPKPPKTIITNNLRLASILSTKNIDCIALGGVFHEPYMVSGDMTIMQASEYAAHVCFFSPYSISMDGVVGDADAYATLRKIMMKNSLKKVLLMTKEKLGLKGSRFLCDLSDVDVIITDIKFSDEVKAKFSNTQFIEV